MKPPQKANLIPCPHPKYKTTFRRRAVICTLISVLLVVNCCNRHFPTFFSHFAVCSPLVLSVKLVMKVVYQLQAIIELKKETYIAAPSAWL